MLKRQVNFLQQKTKKLSLFFYTLVYLQWSQIMFRVYYRLRPVQVSLKRTPGLRPWPQTWEAPVRKTARTIHSLNDVTFLGEAGSLWLATDWNNARKSKLWLYQLHYFDELTSIHAHEAVDLLNALIEKWIEHNPPCKGTGWEPYPLSLRIVNLIKWYSHSPQFITESRLLSLAQQANVLYHRIEYHVRANHLFVNAKALVFIGSYLQGQLAEQYLQKGLAILEKEIKEQFLPDGAHFELSPMYQATLLWDLYDLMHLADVTKLPILKQKKRVWQITAERGLSWLRNMCHPDGDIAFFNDATLAFAPTLAELEDYATFLGMSVDVGREPSFSFMHLRASGYGVVYLGKQSKAIIDVGKVGPDYQPGHAHADTLSFELSLHQHRFIVNSGISQYGNDATRHWQRSTSAHNTVTLNHENSSEVWSGFRVARRAYPKHLTHYEEANRIKIACTHTGYRRLVGHNLHRREWEFLPRRLSIRDMIRGPYNLAEARLYFHPDVNVALHHEGVKCELINGELILIRIKYADSIQIESSLWYPAFGTAVANTCLVAAFTGRELFTEIEW